MKTLKKLEPGDKIAFVAPSGAVPQERLSLAASVFELLGFRVQFGKSCFLRHGYFAGTDDIRADDLNNAFIDDSVSGVYAMRGGYGAQRLMSLLNWKAIAQNPKFFAGYSDCTALHIAVNRFCGFHTYHAPMPSTELYKPVDEYTIRYVKKCLFSKPFESFGELSSPEGHTMETLVPGECRGITTGGNLSLIVSSLGTPYEIDTNNAIVFIEEIDEQPYRIDRMLLQLKNAGKFDSCSGIVFGSFSGCGAFDKNKSLSIAEIMEEIIVPLKKPCLMNAAFGHTLPSLSFPIGKHAVMNAEKKLIWID